MIQGGQNHAQIRRQLAQAMIDEGKLTSGALVLDSILADTTTPRSEQAEARGLIGRIYKIST